MVVAVLQGSTRSGRMGDRAAKWVMAQLTARGHEVHLVDAGVLQLPLLDKMWKQVKTSEDPGDRDLQAKLKPLAELYERVDGFAVVCAEYNHSVPPGLTNLIDYFLEEYLYRPSAIIGYSTSAFGGMRAAVQLRALLPETGMVTIPTLQPIPSVDKSLSEQGVALSQELAEKSKNFFDEFDWYMTALKLGREKHDPRKTQ